MDKWEYVFHKGEWLSKDQEILREHDSLAKWEAEAPANVKREINAIRTGGAVQKALSAIELRKYGSDAKGAISALIETLRDKTSLQWREFDRYGGRYKPGNWTTPAHEAAQTLIKIGKPAISPLVVALRDEKELRCNIATILGEIGKAPVEPVIALLKDEDPDIRGCGAVALSKITGKDFGRAPDKWLEWWEQNRDKFIEGR